ncbi:MAG: hypothetical protein MJZ19_06675 [Paludibacteraceae bacterium]|nr:hypothetical protein [Paludibacteraceae bacterium]
MYYWGWFGYKEAIPKDIITGDLFDAYKRYLFYSIGGIVQGCSMLNGPCWFLVALFYCKLFVDISNKKPIIFFVVWVLLFFILCVNRHRFLFIANAVMAIPFYYLGFYLKSSLSKIEGIRYKVFFILLCGIVILSCIKYNGTVSMWAIKFGNLNKYLSVPIFYFVGVVGSIMVLLFSSLFKAENKYVTQIANSLISILGIQVPLIFLVDNFIGYNLSYMNSFVIALVVMLLCVGFHKLIIKHASVLIGK